MSGICGRRVSVNIEEGMKEKWSALEWRMLERWPVFSTICDLLSSSISLSPVYITILFFYLQFYPSFSFLARKFARDKRSDDGDDSNRIWLSAIFIRTENSLSPPFASIISETLSKLWVRHSESCSREFSLVSRQWENAIEKTGFSIWSTTYLRIVLRGILAASRARNVRYIQDVTELNSPSLNRV